MPKLKISRNKAIAEALVAHRKREEAAADGYRFYAQEASEFAAASLQAVSEVLGRGGEYCDCAPRTAILSALEKREIACVGGEYLG